jgi:NADH-quinone oxidoreductase subunit L
VSGFWLVALPAAAAALGFLVLRRPAAVAAWLGVGGAVAATVVAVVVLLGTPWDSPVTTDVATVATGGPVLSLAARVDGLAAVVAAMVVVVALLVQVYSVDYLRGDPRYPTYAAYVSLFTAAMLLVVVADDLVVLLVGWEVMGLCSYVLIGHDRELPVARAAALKAFLTTRLGDAGFVVGVIVLALGAGSFRISHVVAAVPTMPHAAVVAGSLLLLAGVCGKSAQFPLHVWLPDAMAGPTPISALIHAATMVAAGVYAVVRLYPVFLASPVTLAVMGVIAAVTMLGAALAALAQDDIKRVLAWSTVSQLAYMLGALACGGPDAAIFHLLVHASFKALGFLAVGAVIHATGTTLMTRMGGLGRTMPLTTSVTVLALASGAGVVPLAGFFSKDSVVSAAGRAASGEGAGTQSWVGWLVLVTALSTVVVTAAYSARLLLRTFAGASRSELRPHDPPPFMRWPLVVLAVPAVALGVVGLSSAWLPGWLGLTGPGGAPVSLAPTLAPSLVSLVLVGAGAGAVWLRWRAAPAADPVDVLGASTRDLLADGFHLDALYERVLIRPVRGLGRGVVRFDDGVLGPAVQGVGEEADDLAGALRSVQRGDVQRYVTGALAGVAVVLLVAVLAVVT